MKKTTLVATLTETPDESGRWLDALDGVDVLEVRADLVGDLDPDWLRDRFDGELLYTLRSRAEGGASDDDREARDARLVKAAGRYDLVDLELERDLIPEVLTKISPGVRLLSWHGSASNLTALKGRFERMASTEARYYKLITKARHEGDSLRPLALLDDLRRDDVVSFAMGDIGAWTRVIAPRLGSPLVYGAMGDTPGAPGQMTIERLRRDFGLPWLPEADRLCGILGRPVMHSLSPRLHNGAYRALGIPALYVPFHAESFGDFWLDVVEMEDLARFGLPLRGLSVTAPHKDAALAVAGATSPRADRIGAANTLVWHEGVWEAESTDPEGVTGALEHLGCELEGARAAVVGCGGAGKAAAFGLALAGARVTLVNRGTERGRQASEELGLPFVPLADLDPGEFEVLVQATALGHHADDPLPFDTDRLRRGAAVVEMVYGDRPTALEVSAAEAGCRVVSGREVLLHQALGQFRLMNDRTLEPALASELLGLGDGASTTDREPNATLDNPEEST